MSFQNDGFADLLKIEDSIEEEISQSNVPLGTATSRDTAKIIVVDDEPTNVRIISKYLKDSGYTNIISTSNALSAFNMIQQEQPDVIVLDVMMPGVSGLDILQNIRSTPNMIHTPVLILTASNDKATRIQSLEHGATDFLTKPIEDSELILRIRNALTLKAHHDHLANYTDILKHEVDQQTRALKRSQLEVIYRLARAAEFRDNETGKHVLRVGHYAQIVARKMGLGENIAIMIGHAAPLHDVGKIGIPDSILLKPGKLTPEEHEIMQTHSAMGKQVFDRLSDSEVLSYQGHADVGHRLLGDSRSPILQMASRIAISHHEKWDGTGYPLALAGEDIPIEGRVTAVADVFDALSSKRPYKPAFPLDKCFIILEEQRGTHFDTIVLDAFFAARKEIVEVQIEFADIE